MSNEIRPPAVGDTASDFTVMNARSRSTRLADLCAERPLVLAFYRGHW